MTGRQLFMVERLHSLHMRTLYRKPCCMWQLLTKTQNLFATALSMFISCQVQSCNHNIIFNVAAGIIFNTMLSGFSTITIVYFKTKPQHSF